MPGRVSIPRRDAVPADSARPHVAEELALVDRRFRRGDRTVRDLARFIRGWVRHADHRALRFETWHRVVRNATVVPDPKRLMWVD